MVESLLPFPGLLLHFVGLRPRGADGSLSPRRPKDRPVGAPDTPAFPGPSAEDFLCRFGLGNPCHSQPGPGGPENIASDDVRARDAAIPHGIRIVVQQPPNLADH